MLKILEKLVDFGIASGVAGTAVLLLAAATCLIAFGFAAFHSVQAAREYRRQREATRSTVVSPADDDPTLPIPKSAGQGGIVVADSSNRFVGNERRAVARRSEDHGTATLLQIAANASMTANDARQLAETAEARVSEVEEKLDEKGGLRDRVAVLEGTCLRIESKVDDLPASIVATLEHRVGELVAVEVARQLARGKVATT